MLNRRMFASLYGVAVLTLVVGLAACNKGEVQTADSPTKRAEVTPVPLQHWLQHAELRSLMKQIEEDRQKTVNTVAVGDAATLHPDAHRDFLAASEAAKRLALSAKEMRKVTADIQMTEEDRKAFDEEVDALRNEARKFSIITRKRRADLIEERMQALEATCISCHTRFRDMAGEWQPPRA